jgi:hypothetical protein
MGNRAVITTRENYENDGVGVYLHWNGGRDSVEAFLKYCELKRYRPPTMQHYGWARLCQVIGNFFCSEGVDDGLSLGVDKVSNLDCNNWNNGVYIIDGWEIVGREHMRGEEQYDYPLIDMLLEIDSMQPVKLGEEKIREMIENE